MKIKFKKILYLIYVLLILSVSSFILFVSNSYTVPIIMYHNVADLDRHEANWVNPKNFEMQMKFLKEKGYNVITFDRLIEMTRAGKEFSRKTVVITFDDGYENNYINAFKILKKYEFPAIIFVPSKYIDKPEYLTVEQIKEMQLSGLVTIGSHGRNHKYLLDFTNNLQKEEIEQSKNEIEEILGVPVDYFAYPIGGFSEEIKNMVITSGYRAACTTNRGQDKLNRDVFQLNRIRLSNKDNSELILRAKLSGYYNLFRKQKKPY